MTTATRQRPSAPRPPFRVEWRREDGWRTFKFQVRRSLERARDVMIEAANEHPGITFRVVDAVGRTWSTIKNVEGVGVGGGS
jgi:hypothetical protein